MGTTIGHNVIVLLRDSVIYTLRNLVFGVFYALGKERKLMSASVYTF